MLGVEHNDDQADETVQARDIASADGNLWMATSNALTANGGSLAAAALTALEDDGPQRMAEVLAETLGLPVEVITHPETGLPHLRFTDPADRERLTSRRSRRWGKGPTLILTTLARQRGPGTGRKLNRISRREEVMRMASTSQMPLRDRALLCNVTEAAKLLNIGRTNVYRLIGDGRLRSVKVGGGRLIPRKALEQFVDDLLNAA